MKKQRRFRMTWILPTLLAGVAALAVLDEIHLLKGHTAARDLIAMGFAAVTVLLVAAWFIELVVRLGAAFRRGVHERGVVGTLFKGTTAAAERTADASVPILRGTQELAAGCGAVILAGMAYRDGDEHRDYGPVDRSTNDSFDPFDPRRLDYPDDIY